MFFFLLCALPLSVISGHLVFSNNTKRCCRVSLKPVSDTSVMFHSKEDTVVRVTCFSNSCKATCPAAQQIPIFCSFIVAMRPIIARL